MENVLNTLDPLDKIPISPNDGTLRWFLNLPDTPDNEENNEDLGKLPKTQPNENMTIIEDKGFQHIPLGIMEQVMGINPITEDEAEQKKILSFIKKQTSFGEQFRDKYKNFPEEFYQAIEREGEIVFQHHIDQSGNYTLFKK